MVCLRICRASLRRVNVLTDLAGQVVRGSHCDGLTMETKTINWQYHRTMTSTQFKNAIEILGMSGRH